MTGMEIEKPLSDELTDQQMVAAELLAQGVASKTVAERLELSAKTIQRWRNEDPVFRAELTRQHNLIRSSLTHWLQACRVRVLQASDAALATLLEALDAEKKDGSPDWHTRLWAAKELRIPIKPLVLDPLSETTPGMRGNPDNPALQGAHLTIVQGGLVQNFLEKGEIEAPADVIEGELVSDEGEPVIEGQVLRHGSEYVAIPQVEPEDALWQPTEPPF